MSKAPNYFEHYRNIYSDQVSAISDQWFLIYTLPLFRCRDIDLGFTTLKLNRNLYITKMYLHTENALKWKVGL